MHRMPWKRCHVPLHQSQSGRPGRPTLHEHVHIAQTPELVPLPSGKQQAKCGVVADMYVYFSLGAWLGEKLGIPRYSKFVTSEEYCFLVWSCATRVQEDVYDSGRDVGWLAICM